MQFLLSKFPGESQGKDMRGTYGLGVTLPCCSVCQAFLLLGAVIGFSSKNKKKVEGKKGESEHNNGKGAFRKRRSEQQRAEQRVCLSKVCLASALSASYLKPSFTVLFCCCCCFNSEELATGKRTNNPHNPTKCKRLV